MLGYRGGRNFSREKKIYIVDCTQKLYGLKVTIYYKFIMHKGCYLNKNSLRGKKN